MAGAFRGFNCVNLLLQINRSSPIVVRQARAIFSSNDLQFSVLNERVIIFLMSGTGIAISVWQSPNYQGLEEKGVDNNEMAEGVKKKNNGIEIRADGRCRAVGNSGHGVRGRHLRRSGSRSRGASSHAGGQPVGRLSPRCRVAVYSIDVSVLLPHSDHELGYPRTRGYPRLFRTI